jgi:hypothetical protein
MPLPSKYETKMPGLYFGGYYVAPIDLLHKIGIVAERLLPKTCPERSI